MSRNQAPKCHACGRVHGDNGWFDMSATPGPTEFYETLCKDCLAGWTDHLLSEISQERDDKDQAA